MIAQPSAGRFGDGEGKERLAVLKYQGWWTLAVWKVGGGFQDNFRASEARLLERAPGYEGQHARRAGGQLPRADALSG